MSVYVALQFCYDFSSGEDGNGDSCSSVRNRTESQTETTADEAETSENNSEEGKEETKSLLEASESRHPEEAPSNQDSVPDVTEEQGELSETLQTGESSSPNSVEVESSGWREVTVSGGE